MPGVRKCNENFFGGAKIKENIFWENLGTLNFLNKVFGIISKFNFYPRLQTALGLHQLVFEFFALNFPHKNS
jgi:hypothetical protein